VASLSKSTSIGFSALVNRIQGSLLFPSGTNSMWIITYLYKKNYQHGFDFAGELWAMALNLFSTPCCDILFQNHIEILSE
jgi:hypothetical protein